MLHLHLKCLQFRRNKKAHKSLGFHLLTLDEWQCHWIVPFCPSTSFCHFFNSFSVSHWKWKGTSCYLCVVIGRQLAHFLINFQTDTFTFNTCFFLFFCSACFSFPSFHLCVITCSFAFFSPKLTHQFVFSNNQTHKFRHL